jgi:hypothetical protein
MVPHIADKGYLASCQGSHMMGSSTLTPLGPVLGFN